MQHQPNLITSTVFHILLALRSDELHGYEIIKQIERDTDGNVRLLTGTLYGALKRLETEGLLAEAEGRPAADQDDERRRYYQLTVAGRAALGAELERYATALKLAQQANIMPARHA